MTRVDLASLTRRARNPRRSTISLRPIRVPKTFARELSAITSLATALWVQRSPRVVAAYERSLAQLTTDSPADTSLEITSIFDEVNRLVLQLTPRMRDWALRVERWHRTRWVTNVLSATSVELSTVLSTADVSQTIEAALEWNVALIRDVSAEIRRRISNEVFSGLQQLRPARDVAKALAETTGLARDRTLRIASDQSTKLAARLDQARQQQAGIDEYIWQHSRKLHPRVLHEHRDGERYRWDDPPPDGHPGTLPYCGCVAAPVLSLDD